MLLAKPCSKVINQTDQCGCPGFAYTQKGFCDEKDKKADDLVCNDPNFRANCLTKVVEKVKE